MPGVIARTSTYAFVNAAMPYIMDIANKGVDKAIQDDSSLERAANTFHGELRHIAQLTALS